MSSWKVGQHCCSGMQCRFPSLAASKPKTSVIATVAHAKSLIDSILQDKYIHKFHRLWFTRTTRTEMHFYETTEISNRLESVHVNVFSSPAVRKCVLNQDTSPPLLSTGSTQESVPRLGPKYMCLPLRFGCSKVMSTKKRRSRFY